MRLKMKFIDLMVNPNLQDEIPEDKYQKLLGIGAEYVLRNHMGEVRGFRSESARPYRVQAFKVLYPEVNTEPIFKVGDVVRTEGLRLEAGVTRRIIKIDVFGYDRDDNWWEIPIYEIDAEGLPGCPTVRFTEKWLTLVKSVL